MGNKVAKPAHPGAFGPSPLCLLLPIGSCWWCTFYTNPKNQWTDDCPDAPKGVQLSDSNDSHILVHAGHLEYQGTVYNIEPGICTDNGGVWVIDPSPGGCDIHLDAAIHADMHAAVVDSITARHALPALAAANDVGHDQFVKNIGFLALIVSALFLAMWVRGMAKSVKSKRCGHADWNNLAHTSGMCPKSKAFSDKGKIVGESYDKAIEEAAADSRNGQSGLENV